MPNTTSSHQGGSAATDVGQQMASSGLPTYHRAGKPPQPCDGVCRPNHHREDTGLAVYVRDNPQESESK